MQFAFVFFAPIDDDILSYSFGIRMNNRFCRLPALSYNLLFHTKKVLPERVPPEGIGLMFSQDKILV